MNKETMLRRICDLREEYGYTQRYVAYKLGIDQRTYSVYETGKRKRCFSMILMAEAGIP